MHLSQFNSNTNDLRLTLSEDNNTLSYSIGYQTHFLTVKKKYKEGIKKGGTIQISDIEKLVAFLKKCDDIVTLKQISNGKTLYVISDNMKMNLPITDCVSSQLVPNFEKLIGKAKKNMWQSFGNDKYTVHGKADLQDIVKLSSLKKLMSSDADFIVTANAESKELAVTMGKAHDVKIFCTAKLEDTEGPKYSVKSSFGTWLLPCLAYTNDSLTSKIHFGEASGLVIEQSGNDEERLLIIIDQQE